jgi:hypothetical protein
MIIFFFFLLLKQILRILLYIFSIIFIFITEFIILFYKIEFLFILIEAEAFSYIPWANFFIFGVFLIDILNNFHNNKVKLELFFCLLFGSQIYFLSIFWMEFYPSLFTFLKSMGIFMIIFSICYYYMDTRKYKAKIINPLIQWGQLSFSIYYIQFGLVIVGLMIFRDLICMLILLIPLKFHFLVVVISFFLIIEIILILWKKINYFLGIEWLMNFFSSRSLFYRNKN